MHATILHTLRGVGTKNVPCGVIRDRGRAMHNVTASYCPVSTLFCIEIHLKPRSPRKCQLKTVSYESELAGREEFFKHPEEAHQSRGSGERHSLLLLILTTLVLVPVRHY